MEQRQENSCLTFEKKSKTSQPEPADVFCPHCGSDQLFTRDQAPHVGLHCGNCHCWIRWIPKTEANRFPQQPAVKSSTTLKLAPRVDTNVGTDIGTEPAKPAANACECAEISRLITHLAGIERHLEIVTRAH